MSIVIEQEEAQMHAALRFHARADLDSITLLDAKIVRTADWDSLKSPLTIDIAFEPGTATVRKDCAEIQTRFRFRALDASTPERQAIAVDCTLEASYALEREYKPSSEELEAFQKGNAVFNAWPFFREFVQANANRMSVPPPPVPFLRLVARQAQAEHPPKLPSPGSNAKPKPKRAKRRIAPLSPRASPSR